jgi:hypothetical protein
MGSTEQELKDASEHVKYEVYTLKATMPLEATTRE